MGLSSKPIPVAPLIPASDRSAIPVVSWLMVLRPVVPVAWLLFGCRILIRRRFVPGQRFLRLATAALLAPLPALSAVSRVTLPDSQIAELTIQVIRNQAQAFVAVVSAISARPITIGTVQGA